VTTRIYADDIAIDVTRKKIKNIHLKVLPPNGEVRISAPKSVAKRALQDFARSKLDWIRAQQLKISQQPRATVPAFVDGEMHYLFGRPLTLRVEDTGRVPLVQRQDATLVLRVAPGSDCDTRRAAVYAWYRRELETALQPLVVYWQSQLGVSVERISLRSMRTRWGSCTPARRAIRLNLELAKTPLHCLEYVLVHELVHLIEPSHNHRFVLLMDRFLPLWRAWRDELNETQLSQH